MTPELLLLGLGVLGAGGLSSVLWTQQRARRDHLMRVQTEWMRAGQIVRFGPVGATCYGHLPQRLYRAGFFGALGLADGGLVFTGHRSRRFDASLPIENIQRISLTTIRRQAGRSVVRQRALAVHYDSTDGWRVATFTTSALHDFAQGLGEESGLPVHDTGGECDGFGPARATRMVEDIYGEWLQDRADDLYLAPDRLLFGWREAIPLANVRRLDVFSKTRFRLFSDDLLRVEYETPEGEIASVGFTCSASKWAGAIVRGAGVPLAVYAGRKKKE